MAQHHTGRRHLFRASAAMLLLGTAEAGAAKANELDGELLQLTRQLAAKDAEINAFPHADDGSNWGEFNAMGEQFWVIADQIQVIPARTPEGLQAKARVLLMVRNSLTNETDDPISGHTLGLIGDLLGEVPA